MLAKELLEDPIIDEEIPAVLLQLAAQLLAKAQAKEKNGSGQGDRLLSLEEAAAKLQVSHSWLYRRSKKLSFVVRNGRKLVYSERGIEEYIAAQKGK
jgi:predicted DNA-binding transcriptional regulator AlpA